MTPDKAYSCDTSDGLVVLRYHGQPVAEILPAPIPLESLLFYARRIAAACNACEGLSVDEIEAIEQFDPLVPQKYDRAVATLAMFQIALDTCEAVLGLEPQAADTADRLKALMKRILEARRI